mmetsp:Transcript_21006/g.62126  ORF Transcript_21006/g.62126 Transcript_21006/m.62126 type:complete len:225 (-) Transcript_21006:27-701(-)
MRATSGAAALRYSSRASKSRSQVWARLSARARSATAARSSSEHASARREASWYAPETACCACECACWFDRISSTSHGAVPSRTPGRSASARAVGLCSERADAPTATSRAKAAIAIGSHTIVPPLPLPPPPLPPPPPPPPPLSPLTYAPNGPVTLVAFILPSSSTGSYSIFSPSPSERKPSAWIADWWTKRSSPPLSGVMKPKPFCELNHLTVPVSVGMLTGGLV